MNQPVLHSIHGHLKTKQFIPHESLAHLSAKYFAADFFNNLFIEKGGSVRFNMHIEYQFKNQSGLIEFVPDCVFFRDDMQYCIIIEICHTNCVSVEKLRKMRNYFSRKFYSTTVLEYQAWEILNVDTYTQNDFLNIESEEILNIEHTPEYIESVGMMNFFDSLDQDGKTQMAKLFMPILLQNLGLSESELKSYLS